MRKNSYCTTPETAVVASRMAVTGHHVYLVFEKERIVKGLKSLINVMFDVAGLDVDGSVLDALAVDLFGTLASDALSSVGLESPVRPAEEDVADGVGAL